MGESIRDPPIPYVGAIDGGRFSPGRIVKIQGIVPGTAYRFGIHLQCGPKTVPRDDVAVQVTVRILDGYISLNSLQNGIWGEEQVCVTLPIKRSERFEIDLKCQFNQYEVIINGQHFCDFPQRIHYDRITHLTIDGDVSITQIAYTAGEMGSTGDSDVWVPRATAPVPTLQLQNQANGFEGVNSSSLVTPPPSYDAAVQKDQIGFAAHTTPYPTTTPYPSSGSPYAPTTSPYPTGPNSMHVANPYNTYGSPYPAVGSGIPPPPPGAPTPLNAASSNFRPVRRSNTKKYVSIFGLIAVVVFLIALSVIFKNAKKR